MKALLSKLLLSDGGRIATLVLIVLLLAAGGVQLSRVVAANMLRADGEAQARDWARSVQDSAEDIPAIVGGVAPSDKSLALLSQASAVSEIYKYKVWNKAGKLVFTWDEKHSPNGATTIAQSRGQRTADSILSGRAFTETAAGKSSADTAYFADSYIPVAEDGVFIGVFEVYVDQTSDHALYQQSFLLTEILVGVMVLLGAAVPGFMFYRKMRDHRRAQAEALFLAEHDSLTGLANRKMLAESARGALAWNSRNNSYVAALVLDLDRFKEINDAFGHGVGDEVLQTVAARLKSAVRAEDMVARLGGDEFVVLQVGMNQPDGATSLATRLLKLLAEPCEIKGLQLVCGVSIGVAISPTDAQQWDELLTRADIALYRAKALNRGNAAFFEPGMDALFRKRRRLEADLRRAMDSSAFHLAYQPLVDFEGGRLIGFEALLRWPEGWEPQSPATFIPAAEEAGLIVPIGAWVLETACREAASWTKPLNIAVNLSPLQFSHGDIVAVVDKALKSSGLDPARLELEVTESLWLQNTDIVLDQLAQLRSRGISIALDDFGTGYSSLSYLWKFPFDKVKVDRSFVTQMEVDPKAAAIVDTVVALGRTLDLTITAEGVETPEQAKALKEAGCDQGQGYLFGRPLTPAAAVALINACDALATESGPKDPLVNETPSARAGL